MEGQFDQAGTLGVLRQVLDRKLLGQRAQVGLDRVDAFLLGNLDRVATRARSCERW
jgi:hypothetical protein